MDDFKGNMSELSTWAEREYRDATASRLAYDNLLREWTRQYEMIPKVTEREVPWPDASNIEVGEAAAHTDAAYSRIEEAWFATTPLAQFNYFDTMYKDGVLALQDFVNTVTLPNARYRTEVPHVILGMTKLGTAFQWCSYDEEYYTIYRDGERRRRVTHLGPVHKYVSPRQVIVPPDARDVQSARWVAIRSYYTWGEIVHHRNKGYWSNIDSISQKGRIIKEDAAREGERESGISLMGSLLQWEIVTMFCRYYNPRSRELEEIWVTFDYPSMEILAAQYAPYHHGQRPLTKYTYMIREGAFYGLGIVGMLSSIQEEITNIHNYSLDAMLWAMTGMVSGPKNMAEEISIHPGAFWPKTMPNNKDEYQFFAPTASVPYPVQAEASSRAIGERRTGINDASMQRPGGLTGLSSNRTPVGTAALFLGESNKRFALSIALGKESEKSILLQHVMLIKQFWPNMKSLAYNWNSEKAGHIERLFNLPDESFARSVTVELSMSTAALNRDAERMKVAEISGYMREYYTFVIQMKQLLMQFPQLEPEVTGAIKGANELVELTLNAYDVRNPKELLLEPATIPNAQPGESEDITNQLVAGFLNGSTTGADELVNGGGQNGAWRTPVESDLVG